MKFFLRWIIHSTLICCLKIEPSSTVIETITVLRELLFYNMKRQRESPVLSEDELSWCYRNWWRTKVFALQDVASKKATFCQPSYSSLSSLRYITITSVYVGPFEKNQNRGHIKGLIVRNYLYMIIVIVTTSLREYMLHISRSKLVLDT